MEDSLRILSNKPFNIKILSDSPLDIKLVRDEVCRFASAMENEFKENDYKWGRKDCDLDFLLEKFNEKIEELLEAVDTLRRLEHNLYRIRYTGDGPIEGYRRIVLSEAADIANIVMMIADICKAL